jgi:hypothetical protein
MSVIFVHYVDVFRKFGKRQPVAVKLHFDGFAGRKGDKQAIVILPCRFFSFPVLKEFIVQVFFLFEFG